MDHHEIVKKLIGPIYPVGETNEDNRRFENLKKFINLTDNLLTDIDDLAYINRDAHEFSKKRAAEEAKKYLDRIGLQE